MYLYLPGYERKYGEIIRLIVGHLQWICLPFLYSPERVLLHDLDHLFLLVPLKSFHSISVHLGAGILCLKPFWHVVVLIVLHRFAGAGSVFDATQVLGEVWVFFLFVDVGNGDVQGLASLRDLFDGV